MLRRKKFDIVPAEPVVADYMTPETWLKIGRYMAKVCDEFGVEYPRESQVAALRMYLYLAKLTRIVARHAWAR